MRLHFRVQGEGPPLLILHGLLGSSDNWQSMAKRLAGRRRVYSVDLRNHGRSPHSMVMNYPVMAQDLRELCATENLREPAVLGHSMGGKVAMRLAAAYPEQIEKLIVVDIAPKAYPPAHRSVLTAMRELELVVLADLVQTNAPVKFAAGIALEILHDELPGDPVGNR